MTNALIPVNDIEKMAVAVAKSRLFGIDTPEQGVALMLIAQAEGLHPAIAARDYNIIKGRPALKADAMLARFQQAGGKVSWKVYTDAEVTGVFSHPAGGELAVTWTIAQAKAIGLAGKDNWKNFPRAMLRARCVSEGIRSVYPGCVAGVYTPDEVEEFKEPSHPTPPKNTQTVELVERVEEAEDGAFALYLPGGEDAYSRHSSKEDWNAAYFDLVKKIQGSGKYSDAQKKEKLDALKQANWEIIGSLKGIDWANFRAELAKLGVSNDPKQSVPQEIPEL